jgi:8-oxo-dGTP diphosphatase
MRVVAAVIERGDRRILIGQRREQDTSPLKWEFPGGKVEGDETPEVALARELREELGAVLLRCTEIARITHRYANMAEPLEIRFFAAEIGEGQLVPTVFTQVVWALPRELAQYDFLAANGRLVADLATGRIKARERLEAI